MPEEVRLPKVEQQSNPIEFDFQSAVDVHERLLRAEVDLADAQNKVAANEANHAGEIALAVAKENCRVNQNVLNVWQAKAENLALQSLVTLILGKTQNSVFYRFFPLPRGKK